MRIKTAVTIVYRPDHANSYLDMPDIHEKFERIICTSSVEGGKSNSDVYLYVCEQISERPRAVWRRGMPPTASERRMLRDAGWPSC